QPSNQVGIRFRDGDVAASLDKIATKNNLIARPNMRAIDGRETELFVGEVIRYIVSITSGQNGPNVQTAELPIGVRLAVLPRVGGDGSITMDLRPRVSALRGFLDVPNGGQLPQTTERIAQSTVQVQSGDTIAIGGLIQDQDRKEASGVPLLMDIPILGQLFKKTTNTRVRTEVVLFLTVRTIDDAAGKLEMEKDLDKPTPKPGGKN
ncbi:MAG TPA: type II and III secretion system protein, partial [Fimbriimonadaceae bacterium]|nr:type II and III secretion system protein [Fimbriimonadaceae bacterium]